MNNKYPEFFFRFSGSKHESVKKIGDAKSGWSMGELIQSRLLANLKSLATSIRMGNMPQPVCVFLVGGPGNGKTEAAEYFLRQVYGSDTLPKYETKGSHLFICERVTSAIGGIAVVEDATELTFGQLSQDIKEYVFRENENSPHADYLYLCCINRGVLAKETASSVPESQTGRFLAALSDVVSVGEIGSNMWPLQGNELFQEGALAACAPSVFVWPMDAESLVDPKLYDNDVKKTPGYQLFHRLFEKTDYSVCQNCQDKAFCPFFENLSVMLTQEGIGCIVYCLNAFEIATGNKLLFRDILAVASVLFAGAEDLYHKPKGDRFVKTTPCNWVNHHASILRGGDWQNALASAFSLAARRFNQVLFGDYSEFSTKDIFDLKACLRKMRDTGEFRNIEHLLMAIAAIGGKRKNTTRAADMIHRDFAKRMDIALEEGFDDLESIEIGFCSSTLIGASVVRQKGGVSGSLDCLLEQLVKTEEGLGANSFDVSTEKGDISRRCLQLLQVLGSRMSKREIGGRIPAVFNNEDIKVYRKICFDADADQEFLSFVRKPLCQVLALGDRYSSHVLQSIGQTQLSPKYIFSINAKNACKISLERSKTLPVSSRKPVDSTPEVVIRFASETGHAKSARIRLTFSLFLALRKVREGLSVASIPEQTFVALNLLSSKILGIVSHFSEEPHFSFPEGASNFIWLSTSNKLVREDAQ